MGKRDWVGIGEVDPGSPLGLLWHSCDEGPTKLWPNFIRPIQVWQAEEGRLSIIVMDIRLTADRRDHLSIAILPADDIIDHFQDGDAVIPDTDADADADGHDCGPESCCRFCHDGTSHVPLFATPRPLIDCQVVHLFGHDAYDIHVVD